MAEKISYADLFDFSNSSEVDAAIKKLNSLDQVYDNLETSAKSAKSSLVDANNALVKSLSNVENQTKSLSAASKKDQEIIEKQNSELQLLTSTYNQQAEQIELLNKEVARLSKERSAVSKSTEKLNQTEKEKARLESRLISLTGKNAKEVAKLRLEIQEKNKTLKQEARTATGRITLYQQESQKLVELRNKFRDLVLAEKANTTEAKKMEAQIVSLNNKLTKVDARVGVYGRNVGNYASSWNGLNNSINQLSREAPAFAVSMNTGFLALSNNIPILADEIKNLNTKNKELLKQGKPTQSVFKSIAGAVFSWQTLLSVGVTVLTIYGAKIFKLVGEAINGRKAFEALAEVQEEQLNIASQSIGKFTALVSIVNSNTKSEKERKSALEELNKEYPDFIKSIDDEGKSLNITTSSADAYIETLQKRALAQASLSLIQEKYNELLLQKIEVDEAEKKVNEEANKVRKSTGNIYQDVSFQNSARIDSQKKLIKEQEKEAEIQKEINDLLTLFETNFDENTFGDVAKGAEKAAKKIKEATMATEDAIEEFSGDDLFNLTPFQEKVESFWDLLRKQQKTESDILMKDQLQNTKDLLDEELKLLREAEERKKQLREASFEAVNEIGNQIFENQRIRSENTIKRAEQQKDYELELAGDNAQRRAAIEKEFSELERRERIKQAKAAKRQALFNATLNTAAAIARAFADYKYPISLGIAALAGIQGGIQIGAIASEPLPAFEQGGIVGENSPIITSEAGYEYAVRPDGKLIKTGSNGAEIRTDIPKGSLILNNAISKQLDQSGFNSKQINDDSSVKIAKVLLDQKDKSTERMLRKMESENNFLVDSFKSAIKQIQVQELNIEHGRLTKAMRSAGTRTNQWKAKNSQNGR